MHLSQLVDGGFLVVKQQGRHRYYSIALPEVAHAIEPLGVISTSEKCKPAFSDRVLRYARRDEPIKAGLRQWADLPLPDVFHNLRKLALDFGKQQDDQTMLLVRRLT